MNRLARACTLSGPLAIVWGSSEYHARRIAPDPYSFVGSSRLPWAIAYLALLLVAAYGAGLPSQRPGTAGAWAASTLTVAVAAAGISAAQLVSGSALLPRFVILVSTAALVPWFVLCARLSADAEDRAIHATRAVVVGELSEVSALWLDVSMHPERPVSLALLMGIADARRTSTGAPLVAAVAEHHANLIVLDRAALLDASVVRQAAALHERGIRVRSLTAFSDEYLGKLPVTELERASLMFDIAEIHGGGYTSLKRLMDLACGVVCGLVCVAAVPVVWAGNLLGNRGPLWFRQERVGKGGRVFHIVKFRTMIDDPGAVATWTSAGDPRITRFGRVLRRFHIDELPQAINILNGDLSIVGPRPEQPEYVAELTSKLPFYPLRHLVRPGLTGWAQVKYGYAGDHADALEKLQYEFHYLQHQSLGRDLRIIARTARSLTGGPGLGR